MKNIFADERLLSLGVVNGTTGRDFGSMRVFENQNAVFAKVGVNPAAMLRFHQVHGDRVVEINTDADFENAKNSLLNADAWLITRPATGAVILTADCVPFYIWDGEVKVVGLAHAGWRGVVAKLPQKMARLVKEKGGKDICAFLGPHIQDCCFEVKDDVVGNFLPSSVIRKDGKIFVDLRAEVRVQLLAEGLQQENIHTPCFCTCHNKDMFFSYRRDHTKDAIMSFVYKIN
ncbi:Conserved hypothetical protein DUF152 [Elusimicrobium minutum Pei191]|uniref:Purine nucleoside phosphorylase n=1 Tax=Elusimicrobium minutum (strain Pei191) TaxID=445932 RepID=B2KBT6_ELUMP|nr:peptidoglycan editing factor PgeF [Elusimicrobium minutum]ACC97840.1 Conserved hypothetical protein DUF152 [Elusimicrobium minutum Pei191]